MKRKNGKNQVCVYRKEKCDFSQQIVAIFLLFDNRIGTIFSEGIMEDQYDKKVMVVASLSAIVGMEYTIFLLAPI